MVVYMGLKPMCNVSKQVHTTETRVYPVVILKRKANPIL